MTNVEFNPQENQEKGFKNTSSNPQPKRSVMVGWIMKLSGGKIDETKANYVLLGIAVIFTILTIAMIMNIFGVGTKNKITYKEDIPPELRDAMPQEIYDSLPSRTAN